MKVSLHITLWARRQIIAPEGRWSFRLEGQSTSGTQFQITPTSPEHEYSRKAAETTGRELAVDLGLKVSEVTYEDR